MVEDAPHGEPTHMSTPTIDLLDDAVAVSIARVVAVANRRARELGIDIARSELSLTRDPHEGELWHVHYGPLDYIRHRGGDVTIDVDAATLTATNVVRGQ